MELHLGVRLLILGIALAVVFIPMFQVLRQNGDC